MKLAPRILRTMVSAALVLQGTHLALGQAAAVAPGDFHLVADYDRPGLPVPHWEFRIAADGTTDYEAVRTGTDIGLSHAPTRFVLSQSGMQKLRKDLEDAHGFQPCETKTKGLARMGQKTLAYAGSGQPELRCSFNYTDNKPLAAAADYLSAASYTLEEGITIDRLHRYDRLGLDPVLIRLADAARQGKAPELRAIHTSLEALVADDAILERVRLKAQQLLAASQLQ